MVFQAPAAAIALRAEPFITAKQLDLTHYLPAPPPEDSERAKAEIAEVLAVQTARTVATAELVKAYAIEGIEQFWPVLGATRSLEISPRAALFFERLMATEAAIVDPAKAAFARLRPHMVDDQVKPVVKRTTSGAWPSGHASNGWMHAIILADMMPERREALFNRADEISESRIIGGIHRRSDVLIGRQAGSLIALTLLNNSSFRDELAPVRDEIRTLLSLPK